MWFWNQVDGEWFARKIGNLESDFGRFQGNIGINPDEIGYILVWNLDFNI